MPSVDLEGTKERKGLDKIIMQDDVIKDKNYQKEENGLTQNIVTSTKSEKQYLLPFPTDIVKKAYTFKRELAVKNFTAQLNSYVNRMEYECLDHKVLERALMKNNILEYFVTENKGVGYYEPTEKGYELGIKKGNYRTDKSENIPHPLYSKRAQEYVVNHLDHLLSGEVDSSLYGLRGNASSQRKQEIEQAYQLAIEAQNSLMEGKRLILTYLHPATEIIHKKLGKGKILSIDDDARIEVSFEKAGVKELDSIFLFANGLISTEDGIAEKVLQDYLPYFKQKKEISNRVSEVENVLKSCG